MFSVELQYGLPNNTMFYEDVELVVFEFDSSCFETTQIIKSAASEEQRHSAAFLRLMRQTPNLAHPAEVHGK